MVNINKNKELRTKLRQDPHSIFSYTNKDVDIVVKTNTKDTTYMIISKLNHNIAIDSQELKGVNAAGILGSISSISTAGTVSTVVSSLGSASSIGSAATAGTADAH